jgi:NAD+ synthase (glutamine-hydrolysing)
MTERRRTGSVGKNNKRLSLEYRFIKCSILPYLYDIKSINRPINPYPFVPSDPKTLDKVCKEIFDIQVAGLIKRMKRLGPDGKYQIGISGGLDSTLALLVAIKACEKLGWNTDVITGTTMPGFGTSAKTKSNAIKLMELTGIKSDTIDICQISMQMMRDIGHKPFGLDFLHENPGNYPGSQMVAFKIALTKIPPDTKDLVFENIQARARTFVLMSKGFVIGTGDLSELALGWCTFNGDHMSMYNPNCSIPKTLVIWLVKYVAEHLVDAATKEVLLSIIGTTISPELLPLAANGEIAQSTEDMIGPYELHDFFLFNFIRNGYEPCKILDFATVAFNEKYSRETIKEWLIVFINRFFFAQFKRNCVPNGPKVGSLSLSPRSDWRMSSDSVATLWLEGLE